MSMSDRVAVVVVHGIADQQPGQTVRELARLLCQGGTRESPYVQGEIHDVLIPVEKLAPGNAQADDAAPATQSAGDNSRRPTRWRPGTPSGFYQAQHQAPVAMSGRDTTSPASQPKAVPSEDLGIALNDYLLGRFVLPEGDALYESKRVSLRHRIHDKSVDLFEMYWADLSRLGTGGLRALTSLYQLFFHLGKLAADVVDQASLGKSKTAGWRLLRQLHAWMAWLMIGPVAVLQLAMLLMVLFGAATLVAPESRTQLIGVVLAVGGIVLLAAAGFVRVRSIPGPSQWGQLLTLAAAAAACFALAGAVLTGALDALVSRTYFGASAVAIALLGSVLIERYSRVTEGVRILGHFIIVATFIMLCVTGERLLPSMSTPREWMITAALNVTEWLLAGALLAWGVFVALQIVALLLGPWLGRACDAATKASLHTSRLALVGSSGFFAVLSLVLWSVMIFVVGRTLADISYMPILLGKGYRSAEIFLDSLVTTLGAFFTPLVLAFSLLGTAAALVLLPSLIEEISPSKNRGANGAGAAGRAQRLAGWLGCGARMLGMALKPLVPLGAIAGGILYLAFILEQSALSKDIDLTDLMLHHLAMFQGDALVTTGKWLAGGALTIAALGSRFTQTFGRLRVAIDAVLDIDNYFSDPPNRQPPRARIYSRYASLLRHLRDAGYSRIVIVAHSQGTVISADLLRYLHVKGRRQAITGTLPIALVTVGSPLRDLYAERFPLLYQWMGSRDAGFAGAGPATSDIGVVEWINACRSGDYVGRFIWTPDREPTNFGVATCGPDGMVGARRAGGRTEFCLGAGAHTHYFSDDAVALALEIERVMAGERA